MKRMIGRIVRATCVLTLLIVIGIAAKSYVIPVGDVDKARLNWFTVVVDGKKISAECYWDLMDTNGVVIAAPQKTVVKKVCDTKVKKADLKAFLVGEFMDHIDESRVKFTDSTAD